MDISTTGPTFAPGTYTQVYYRRSMGRQVSTDFALPNGGTDCNLDFHLMPIEFPIRVTGFTLGGATGCTSGTLMRLYVQASDPANNYMPYGTPLIDTGAAGFTVGDAQLTAAVITNGDKYKEVTLSNAVDIILPGIYWVGVFVQSPAAGGTWRGTTTRSHIRGLRDLKYTGATAPNGKFATFSIPTSVVGRIECAGDNRAGNLQIGLICQRLG